MIHCLPKFHLYLLAYAQEDGSLLISGPNSNVMCNDSNMYSINSVSEENQLQNTMSLLHIKMLMIMRLFQLIESVINLYMRLTIINHYSEIYRLKMAGRCLTYLPSFRFYTYM